MCKRDPVLIIFLFFFTVVLSAMEQDESLAVTRDQEVFVVDSAAVRDFLNAYIQQPLDLRRLLGNYYLASEGWQWIPALQCHIKTSTEPYSPEEFEQAVPYVWDPGKNRIYQRMQGELTHIPFLTKTLGHSYPIRTTREVLGPNALGTRVCNTLVSNHIAMRRSTKKNTREFYIPSVAGSILEIKALHPTKNQIIAKCISTYESRIRLSSQVFIYDMVKDRIKRRKVSLQARSITAATYLGEQGLVIAYKDKDSLCYRLFKADYPLLTGYDCTPMGNWLPDIVRARHMDELDLSAEEVLIEEINAIYALSGNNRLVLLEIQPKGYKMTSGSLERSYCSAEYHYVLYDIIQKKRHYLPMIFSIYAEEVINVMNALHNHMPPPPVTIQFGDRLNLARSHLVYAMDYAPGSRTVLRVKPFDDNNNDPVVCMLLVTLARAWLAKKQTNDEEGKAILELFGDKRFIANPYKLLWQFTTVVRLGKRNKEKRTNPFKQVHKRLHPKKRRLAKLLKWRGKKK